MKIKLTNVCFLNRNRLLMIIMRTFIFLFCTAIFALGPNNLVSQNSKIKIKEDKVLTVDEIFDLIMKQTDYKFFYEEGIFKNSPKIHVKKGIIRTNKLLSQSLSQDNLNITITANNSILLKEKPKSEIIVDQQRTITGVITDTEGVPLAGANILEKGTSNGAQTDFDGKFSLILSNANSTISVSYVGFLTQEITVNNQTSITIELREDAAVLDEVVIVGYGSKVAGEITGAVSKLDTEQLESRPKSSIVEALQGAVPGLQIVRGDGKIGQTPFIRLRGLTSTTNAGVLTVIDGLIQPGNGGEALNNINPDDIKNITFLKDAAAAIYGARAAGGVIIVTTKKGKSRKPVLEYSTNISVNTIASFPKRGSIRQFFEMSIAAADNDGITGFYEYLRPQLDAIENGTAPEIIPGPFTDTPFMSTRSTDWIGFMFQDAVVQKHQFSVSGSTDKSNYYASVGYLDQPSTFKWGENSNKRYFGRVKYSFDVNDKLKISTNISMGRQALAEPIGYNAAIQQAFNVWPSHLTRTPEGRYANFGGFQSPLAHAEGRGDSTTKNFNQSFQIAVDWNPIEELTIHADAATNVNNSKTFWLNTPVRLYDWDEAPRQLVGGSFTSAGTSHSLTEHIVTNAYATYAKSLKDHSFSVMVGTAHEELDFESFGVSRKNLITPELNSFGQGADENGIPSDTKNGWVIDSYFGRFSYDFNKKYLLDVNFRRDGSSRFSPENRWGNFWGVQAAWILSDESFMGFTKPLFNNIKLRVSRGSLGNQNNVGLFDFLPLVGVGGTNLFGNPDSPTKVQGASIGSLASSSTTWETVLSKNIGIDFSMLNNRLSGHFDYFVKDVSDLLVVEEFPTVIGINTPLVNGGSLTSKGWELSLNWNDKIGDNFSYNVNFSLSDDRNKITSLDKKIPTYGFNQFVEGYQSGTYFTLQYDGFIQTQEELDAYTALSGYNADNTSLQLGDVKYKDLDGDGVIEPGILYEKGNPESGDMAAIGDTEHRFPYSLNLSAQYKNFDFSMFFQGIGKWNIMTSWQPPNGQWWTAPYAHFYEKDWTPERTNAPYPRLTQNGAIDGANWVQSDAPYKFVDNKYIRLKNLQIGYNFPKQTLEKIGLTKLRVYFSGNDLWETSNIPGNPDPEIRISRGGSFTPNNRSYSIGLNVNL